MNGKGKNSLDKHSGSNSSIIHPGLWVSGKNLQNVKEKLRKKVPPIRIAPNYKTIIKNLHEEGCENSALYIENLLELEKNSLIEGLVQKTILKGSFDIMVELIQTLKAVENYPNDSLTHLNGLLKYLCEIKDVNKYNRWLIEQVFLFLKNYTKSCDLNDNGLLETKINLYYGKFLSENELYEEALRYLLDAKNKCKGNFWIMVNSIDSTQNVYVYNYINNLIAICYMRLYKIEENNDFGLASEHAENALKYANASLIEETVAKANLLLANVLIHKNQPIQALNYLEIGISHASVISDLEILCKCYTKKAQIYHERGRIDLAEEYMQQVLSFTEENDNLPKYIGKSLRLLAKWNSDIGNHDKAANYYSQALKKFLVYNAENIILETRIQFSQMFYKILGSNYFELIESITSSPSPYHQSRPPVINAENSYAEDRYNVQQQQQQKQQQQNKLSTTLLQQQKQELRQNFLDKILIWRCKRIPFWYGEMNNKNLNEVFCNEFEIVTKMFAN